MFRVSASRSIARATASRTRLSVKKVWPESPSTSNAR